MRIRLIATDLDGTLLRSDATISARTREALTAAERAGLAVVSVTARPPRRVRLVAFAIEAGVEYGCEPAYRILREHPHDRADPNMRRGDALALSQQGVTKLIVQPTAGAFEALAVAREVTCSNDEDGVACTLEALAAREYRAPCD